MHTTRTSMRDFAVAIRYNVWLRVGWLVILASSIGLGYSTALSDFQLLRTCLVIMVFGFIPVIVTGNGRGTIRVYNRALKRLRSNAVALAHELQALPFPWEMDSLSSTYCARAGVKGAACHSGFEAALPRGYTKWWRLIDTRPRYTRGKR